MSTAWTHLTRWVEWVASVEWVGCHLTRLTHVQD